MRTPIDIYLVVYSYEMNNPQITPFAYEDAAKDHFFDIAKEQKLKHNLDLSSPLDHTIAAGLLFACAFLFAPLRLPAPCL